MNWYKCSQHDPMFLDEDPERELQRVLQYIKLDGRILARVPEKYKHNYMVVLEAVRNNGGVLQVAGDEFKDDDYIVQTAIENNPAAILYASPRLQEQFKQQFKQ
jgi:fructose-1,6-bisphosphatase